ncbi:MAG: DUF1801 domain-containing protein [Armatimonadota bacterium]|nr:DUF1801 domain-containing protein [Armatimonadota bacterium]
MATKTTAATPEEYIAGLDEPRRSQIRAIYDLVREAAPELEPFMIPGKVGFGRFKYKGKTSEGEWFKLGLASNKNTIAFYTCAPGVAGETLAESFASRLPRASIGKSCINFKKLEDADMQVLREIAQKTASADFSAWVM